MRTADERDVVAPHEGTVERRTDTGIRLGADDDQSAHTEPGQDRLEPGRLERVAVVLLDMWLGVIGIQLGNDLPAVTPRDAARILDPHDGHPLTPGLRDKAPDVGDDRIPL